MADYKSITGTPYNQSINTPFPKGIFHRAIVGDILFFHKASTFIFLEFFIIERVMLLITTYEINH